MFVGTVTVRVAPLLTTRPSSLFVIMPMLILTSVDFPGFSCNFILFLSLFLLKCKMFALIAFLPRTNSEKVTFVEVMKDEVEGTRDCCHHRLHSGALMPLVR